MQETIIKHPDTQIILAFVQVEMIKERKEAKKTDIISLKTVIINEYFKRKRDVVN